MVLLGKVLLGNGLPLPPPPHSHIVGVVVVVVVIVVVNAYSTGSSRLVQEVSWVQCH